MRLYHSPNGYELTVKLKEGATVDQFILFDGSGTEILRHDITTPSISIDYLQYDDYLAQWMNGETVVAEQYFDVASFPYFSLEEMKADLAGTKTQIIVEDAELASKREIVEDWFDDAARCSFCIRGYREKLYGTGSTGYALDKAYVQEIISLTVDGKAVGPHEYSIRGLGILRFKIAVADGAEIVIHYTHGQNKRTSELTRFAMMYCRSILGSSNIDPRATGERNEFGYLQFSVAGKNGATGIPEVDAFLSSNHGKGGQGVNRMFVL